MQNMIFALAGSVPETRLQHQIGGAAKLASPAAMSYLVAGASIFIVLWVLKKLLTD